MVPRTSHRVANHQSLGEGAAVMRAGCADREDFITAAREQHGVLANVPADHAAIGKIIERDAAREIGSFRLGLLGGHNVLPIAGSIRSFGWRCTRRHAPIGVSRQSASQDKLPLFIWFPVSPVARGWGARLCIYPAFAGYSPRERRRARLSPRPSFV